MAVLWRFQNVSWPRSILAAAREFLGDDDAVWLDSSSPATADECGPRWSLLATRPLAVIQQREGRAAELRSPDRLIEADENFWALWRRSDAQLPRLPLTPAELSPGWIGYLGFELGAQLERLPPPRGETLGMPTGRLALFGRAIALDHVQRRAMAIQAYGLEKTLRRVVSVSPPDDEDWLDRWESACRASEHLAAAPKILVQPELSRAEYARMVLQALAYIRAGDIYQVNLAHRLLLRGVWDAFAFHAATRTANPAPYAALLRWGRRAVCSASPELFLRRRGDRVRTSPIKGTRPRTGDAMVDASYQRELLESTKDAAELAMIVDLHRNDLGRVCVPGSVRVEEARRIEMHPSVIHTVADVVGRLAAGRNTHDLISACFPAGSISGVPKIRAQEIIRELEPVARGAYCGAIGAIGLDGQVSLSVAIRTVQICGDQGALYVGGGIVADSDPEAEYEETLAKGRGILAAAEGFETYFSGMTRGERESG